MPRAVCGVPNTKARMKRNDAAISQGIVIKIVAEINEYYSNLFLNVKSIKAMDIVKSLQSESNKIGFFLNFCSSASCLFSTTKLFPFFIILEKKKKGSIQF